MACSTGAREVGIDERRLEFILSASHHEKLAVCDHHGDEEILLAWCDTSETILNRIARNASHRPLVRMGLAFNRATPLRIIRELMTASGFLDDRPLFRHRCYTHQCLKATDPVCRRQLLSAALEREPLPRLQKVLKKMHRQVT